MKKTVGLMLVLLMIIGTTVLVYADTDDLFCELDPETWEEMLEYKKAYLDELVIEGVLTQPEADELFARLEGQESYGLMRGFGFGRWFRGQDDFEEFYELMPHYGLANENGEFGPGGFGCGRGRGFRYQDSN